MLLSVLFPRAGFRFAPCPPPRRGPSVTLRRRARRGDRRPRGRDAQCGCKAVSRTAAEALLPWVRSGGWFFDSELLLLARRAGYAVHRNKPYAGGFITEHYGAPQSGIHAIQIEVNRALYMDERRYQRAPPFARLAGEFDALADRLAAIPIEELRPYRAAAAE